MLNAIWYARRRYASQYANQALLCSAAARNGSGPLKASFLTMLLVEDMIA